MKQEVYWKKFESSGQIQDYMQFKQSAPTAASDSIAKENSDANDHAGACAPCDQNG